jgi:hypothetical protein
MSNQTLYIAIPSMDELELLPFTLDAIARQQCEARIKVYICVNQPESWWADPTKHVVCTNNQQTIRLLENYSHLDITLLDRSSRGYGWNDKKQGVGCARKDLIKAILQRAADKDILVNMDADTVFEPDYCQSLADNLYQHTRAVAIAVPYYHPLSHRKEVDRALLRYEIYTRIYNLNLLRIGSPYSYTALGSAIVCPINTCRVVGGFDSQTAGEDFYFLQKMCKYGEILRYNSCKVYPSARYSSRVPFGTGTAIDKGSRGDWSSYPIFHYSGFDKIKEIYNQMDVLFEKDIANEFTVFLEQISANPDLWTPLRKNYKTEATFTRAFHHKVDGLRIFQFLRNYQLSLSQDDEDCLSDFFKRYYPNQYTYFFGGNNPFSFANTSIKRLDNLRDFLMQQETIYQQTADYKLLQS